MHRRRKTSVRRFLENISPSMCRGIGAQTRDDKLLKDLQVYRLENHNNERGLYPVERVHVSQVWSVCGQRYIDEVINSRGKEHWYAVPGLNPVEFPCYPGALILVTTSMVPDVLTKKRKAHLVGPVTDFFPNSRNKSQARLPLTQSRRLTYGTNRKLFVGHCSSKGAVITADIRELVTLESDFNKHNVFIDLSNFEYTNFNHKLCYIVTKVIMSHNLRLELTHDGTVFYESVHEAPVPICYQVSKVQVTNDQAKDYSGGLGIVKSITPVTGRLPFYVAEKRSWQNFFNSFMPNQERLNSGVGDYPTRIEWKEPQVKQYFRPDFFHNLLLGKPVKNSHFTTEEEYRTLLEKHTFGRYLERCASIHAVIKEPDREDLTQGEDETELSSANQNTVMSTGLNTQTLSTTCERTRFEDDESIEESYSYLRITASDSILVTVDI